MIMNHQMKVCFYGVNEGGENLIIYVRGGLSVETSMKHGTFTDLMQDDDYDFVVVPDVENELKLYNIRKEAIDMVVAE